MRIDRMPTRSGRHPQPSPESASALRLSDSTVSVIVNQPPAVGTMDADRFVLELAGQGTTAEGQPSHLVMRGDPCGSKYETIRRHLTIQDCQGHIEGTTTLGGHLTWRALCRAICWDMDDADGYALLERTAHRLLHSGAWPILEQAPLPDDCPHAGGGKLWLTFASRVPHSYAFGTAERYAPELRQVRERFPGSGLVRLPGGFYRHGVNVWSEVRAIGSDDDVWYTGTLAIQTIMEHLTPAMWVQPIEPQPAPFPQRAHKRLPVTIHAGEGRNTWLTAIAGADRRWGMTADLILERLESVNQRHCDPPLDSDELRRIADGMERYAPGARHGGRPRLRIWTGGRHA